MVRQLTEETVGTEQTMAENLKTENLKKQVSLHEKTVCLLTLCLLLWGCSLPGAVAFKKNVDKEIASYVWISSALFLVFGTGIWIDILIGSIKYKKPKGLIHASIFMVCLYFAACLSVFIWFCLS